MREDNGEMPDITDILLARGNQTALVMEDEL